MTGWRLDLQRWGVWRFCYWRIMDAVKPWLTLCCVHVAQLSAGAVAPTLPEGFRVGVANRDELMSAAHDAAIGLRPAMIDQALARGDICAAAFKDNVLVAYTWRSFTTAPHVDGLWVAFARPYRYGYDAVTHPDFRGLHLQEAVARTTDALCIQRGFPKGIGFVESHNYASLAMELRRGNKRVGWAGYVNAFGRAYPFRSPGTRKHTFSFVRRSSA